MTEENPGVGLHFTDGDHHKMIGVYRNSIRRTSVYALYAWTPIDLGRVHVGAIGGVGGVVTGYKIPYAPAAGLFTMINITDKINLNVTVVPTIRNRGVYGFAGFQLNVKL